MVYTYSDMPRGVFLTGHDIIQGTARNKTTLRRRFLYGGQSFKESVKSKGKCWSTGAVQFYIDT